MRSALATLLCGVTIAVVSFAMPMTASAAPVPIYFGGLTDPNDPLLPCTGFFSIVTKLRYVDPQKPLDDPATPNVDEATYIEKDVNYQPVSLVATNNKPTCQSLCDVFVTLNNILRFAISVLISIFLPVMFLIGGFYILTSGGNSGRRAKGIQVITATLIGLAIALCSALIVGQMMTFIFQKSWGESLKTKLTTQAGPAGVDPGKIPDFSWNELSCSIDFDGGVRIGTGSTNNP